MILDFGAELRAINTKKSTIHAAIIGIVHVGVALAAAMLAARAFAVHAALGLVASLLAIMVIGTRLRAINNMSHECFHRAYTKIPAVNEVFGHVFAVLELSSFLSFRREHGTHHSHLGDYDKDLDFAGLEKYGFHEPVTRASLRRHLRRALTLAHVPTYAFVVLYDSTEPAWAKAVRCAYLSGLVTLAVVMPWYAFAFVVLPFLTTYQIQKYLTDMLDHGGLLKNEHEIDKSRNFIIKRTLLRWLFFPRNDCYHLVHHLFPFLAVENFAAAHRIIGADEQYRRIPHQAAQQLNQWLAQPRTP